MTVKNLILAVIKDNNFYQDVRWALSERGFSGGEIEELLREIVNTDVKEDNTLYLIGWHGWDHGSGCHGLGANGPMFSIGLYTGASLEREFCLIPMWDGVTTVLGGINSFEHLNWNDIVRLSAFMDLVPAPLPCPEMETVLSAEVDSTDLISIVIEVMDELLRLKKGERCENRFDPELCDCLCDHNRRQCKICIGCRVYSQIGLYQSLKRCLELIAIENELK